MRTTVLLIALFCMQWTSAQDAPVISYEEYMSTVLEHHPLARVADIKLESGDAMLQSSRGNFDPIVQGSLNRKDFDGSRYYDILQGGIKVPTWLGVTVEGGYSQNDGVYLNPERLTPNQGLVHAGIRVPLGEGLFMDKRRAELRKAELARDLADFERKLLINDLILEAGTAYWNWFQAHHTAAVYAEVATLAQQRYEAVSQAAQLGDVPSIDTLEASIQFQARTILLQEATLAKKNAAAIMSVYLWLEGQIPASIATQSSPASPDLYTAFPVDPILIAGLEEGLMEHPLITAQSIKLDQAAIDQRWKREQLKPQVDLKYNALSESLGGTELNGFNDNNYTLGFEVSMPILLRKERGALQLANLKIEQQQMDLAVKRQDIWLKARKAINEWDLVAQQLDLFEGTARDYASLLAGEQELFKQGESSLFLVNRRETSYVNAQVKLLELKAKNRKAELKSRFALATLDEE